jgi:two-component system NarL family sensor kinase
MIRKNIIILLLFFSCKNEHVKNNNNFNDLNQILVDARNSPSTDLALEKLKSAKKITNSLPNDTIKSFFNRKIACEYYNFSILEDYYTLTKENIEFSKKINDTLFIGKLYYDLGDYFFEKNINDSSFYYYHKALKSISNNNNEKVRTQFNIAKLLLNENQLIECEVQLFKTISSAEKRKDFRLLYECYSILGGVQNGLKNFDEALLSYKTSQTYLDKIPNDQQYSILLSENYNNTATVYVSMKDYQRAIELYLEGLKRGDIRKDSPKVYAMLIDNLAYVKLQNGKLQNPNSFFEALKIRDSLDNKLGIIISNQRIGEYYLQQKDSLMANRYFSIAYNLAKKIRSFRDQLVLLKLKKQVDPKNASKFQDTYINISDSMLTAERTTRNKFAKIEFETEHIEQEKKVLTKKMNFILIFATLCFLLLGLVYVLYRQKVKYKVLFLEKEQQKSNEEVYNLLLTQQQQLEQGKALEKKRVSTELHDGVISKLFGIRIHLERLIFLDKKIDVKKVESYFEKLNELENEIRVISHKLSDDAAFTNQSFILIVQNYLSDFAEDNGIETELHCTSSVKWESINSAQKMNLFRIIQEALTNIRKHAQAKKVVLSFDIQNDAFKFTISDDGIGFNVFKNKNGIGLKNIHFRLEYLKGNLIITSDDKGTRVEGNFPIALLIN